MTNQTAEALANARRYALSITSEDLRRADLATVGGACEEIKRLIGWLEYIRENEFTSAERKRLVAAAARFANVAQPIANKYMD